MELMWREAGFAVRLLRRTPVFTVCAVLMLSVAIGAATAVFSVVNAALLRPFPHVDLDRWARLFEQPANEGLGGLLAVSTPNYRDWKRESRSFAAMALWMPWSFNLSGDGADAERVEALVVTPDLFHTLGLTPAAGRLLREGDESAPINPDRPIMISHGLWQRRFGGDPAIAGRTITLNLVPHTVVGVAPRDFAFPPDLRVDVWAPQSARGIATAPDRSARGLQVSAMLRPGATWESARAEMNVIAARLAATYPENEGFGVAIVPMRETFTGEFRAPLLVMLGALGLVMLLVCVNVANLQLVRLEARRRELAVRAALGASRARLIREALMESLLLALAAGAMGFALAPFFVRLLLTFVPSREIPWLTVPTDGMVLLVTAGITCAVTVIAGVLPAARSVRLDVSSALARGGWAGTAASTSRRLRHAFVVAQLALSFVLVAGAALLIQSFLRLQQVDPGFTAKDRLTLSYTAPRARYGDVPKLADLGARIREAVVRTPGGGVVSAAAAQAVPFSESASWFQALSLTDPRSVPNLGLLPHVHFNVVTPGYAETLGVPLEAGRTFSERDDAMAPAVVVINESLATRFFPNANPLGQQLWVGHAQALPESPRRTVIGVVGDMRWSTLDAPAGPEAWVPLAQQAGSDAVFRTMLLVVHTTDDPAARVPAIRAQIRSVDKDLAITSIRTLDGRVDEAVWRHRLGAAALGALGVAALLIALLGVFGVTNHLVGRRAHEMGVRLALGARPAAVVRLVMTESGWLVLIGVSAGAVSALAAARYAASLLYGVTASDAPTFVVTALLLAAAALLASFVPARRAGLVDPVVTLRPE